jgi:hypothetical protein
MGRPLLQGAPAKSSTFYLIDGSEEHRAPATAKYKITGFSIPH